MLLSDRRNFLILAASGLAGCGFKPLYSQNGDKNALLGGVTLQEAVTPEDYAFRERLRRRFDQQGAGNSPDKWQLSWRLVFEEKGVAITRDDEITRHQISASAEYIMNPLAESAQPPVKGITRASGGYDATAEAYATYAARKREYEQLAVELAELTATRLLAQTTKAST